MDKREIIERLKNIARHAVHTVGEEPFVMSLDDGIAVHEAIEALDKDTNVPSKSALDHIHNVVAENEYKRGYEQGKADAAPKWIPVTPETLPKEGQDVLITKEPLKIKGYEQEVVRAKRSVDPRSGKIEWWSEFGALTNKAVLAWMPLPEPYKGGEADG